LLLTVLILVSSFASIAALDRDRLASDVATGQIGEMEALLIRAIAAVRPDQVPDTYQTTSEEIDKSATTLIRDAWAVMQQQPELAANYAGILYTRPTTELVYESPGGFFRLHYDTTGSHAVPTADINTNDIPDYVERAAELADSVQAYELFNLGYIPPPSDGTLGGGINQYDIYFQVQQFYGYTSPETTGPAAWDDYSSHMVVHSHFDGFPGNDDPEGDQIGALKVTLAHEFFHAIHFGLDAFTASYWMEMTSTWMEEMVFPEVNDNYQYLDDFFNEPQEGLQHDGVHRYGSFVWPKFLEETQGIDVIRDIWHNCRYASAYSSMIYVLDTLGAYLPHEFLRFVGWNFLTGSRADTDHYEDAADYPEIRILRSHTIIPDSNWFSTEPPEALASNYIEIVSPGDLDHIFTFELDGDPTVTWGLAYVIDYGAGVLADTFITSVVNGEGKAYVPYFDDVERVVVIPAVTSNYGGVTNFFYDLYVRTQGDADGNHTINISDATFIISYIFSGGVISHPWGAMDADCDHIVNITDAIFLINYIFAGGPAPCPPEE
jgi:hypothetical protein